MLLMAAFLAPALALAPAGKSDAPADRPVRTGQVLAMPGAYDTARATEAPVETPESPATGWMAAEAWRGEREARQVRIRQEITIRVSPRRNTREMVADWRTVVPRKMEQREIGKCIPARSIVAVQTVSSRDLVLYLSDNRMIRAQLRKSCSARDFYLGFQIEPNKDGDLCVGRDVLRTRNGAACKLGAIRQLVPAD